jgi:hypothetical protein
LYYFAWKIFSFESFGSLRTEFSFLGELKLKKNGNNMEIIKNFLFHGSLIFCGISFLFFFLILAIAISLQIGWMEEKDQERLIYWAQVFAIPAIGFFILFLLSCFV